jgi:hypothetical protein
MEQNPVRPWYKKKRYIIPLGVVGMVTVASAMGGMPPSEPMPQQPAIVQATTTTPKPEVEEPVAPPAESAPSCDPNYSGCLKPNAGDYDCAGGSGNGPNYTGRVQVLGYDEFGLDRDGDGWGCD